MAAKGGAAAGMRKVAKKAKTFPRLFVDKAATDIRKAATKSLKGDTGDGRMSGVGNAQLKVVRKVKDQGVVVIGQVRAGGARGPWFWLEEGTRPHRAGGRFKGARHPGTRAKRTWSRPLPPAMNKARQEAWRHLRTIVRG